MSVSPKCQAEIVDFPLRLSKAPYGNLLPGLSADMNVYPGIPEQTFSADPRLTVIGPAEPAKQMGVPYEF